MIPCLDIYKKLKSSIILLIIGFFMVKSQIIIGDGCKSMASDLVFAFLTICYIICFIIIQIRLVIKINKRKEPYHYTPLLITFLLFFAVLFSFNLDSFESTTFLRAISEHHHTIVLRKNNTYKIQIRWVEASCYYKGKYQIINDTVILLGDNIENRTDSAFYSKYYLDKKMHLLYPVEQGKLIQDSTKVLTIEGEY